ncbi:MAG TPA: ATP-binding cassette domain-containing protein [Bacteroidetes bacterium]|nr:ATP-binding cassette domain-containing protein [Bacteroidota bacterium]
MTVIDQQLRTNDCGISAIKTTCNALGVGISRQMIEDKVPLDQQGATLESMDKFFREFGFETKFQLLDVHSLDDNEEEINSLCPFITPVIAKRGLHYVVIEKLREGQFFVLDPAEATRYKLNLQEFKHRTFFSQSMLDLVELKDILQVKISEELAARSIEMPENASGKALTEMFNKLNYFNYVQGNYPFLDEATENAFLTDLLHNQDMEAVPKNFRSLKAIGKQIEVQAPILLSVKKTEKTVQPDGTEEGEENVYLKLFRSIRGIRDLWAIFIATTFIAAGITYVAVFINQILIDYVLPSYQINTLVLFAVGVGVFYLFDLIFSGFKRYFSIHLGNVFDKYFLSVFDQRLNNYSVRYLDSFRRGDLVERLSDSMKIKSFFMTFFSKIFVNVVVAVFSIAILMAISWKLTMVVFLVLFVFAGLFFGLTPHIKKLERQRFARKADFFSRFIEKIEGIQVIKSLQLEHYSTDEIKSNINALIEVRTKSKLLGLFNSIFARIVTSFSTLTIIVLASREMILHHAITLGMIITFIALSRKIFRAFRSLLDYNLSLQEHQVILHRFFDFYDKKQERAALVARDQIQQFRFDKLELEDLFFAYRDEEYVLSELNLEIVRGEKIWIQGRNGSGKSTLCKILSFLYRPSKGAMRINGMDAGLYDERRLKSKVAFVSADDLIFNESLLFNITFGQQTDIRKLVRLAKAIDFYTFIDKQPEKFNYVLHEKGRNLSTGQRRKLLLLRALMTKADVVILDEIFNGIDKESKFKAEMLLNSIDDRAFIVISHTPVEEIYFDKKYKLKNGYLLEQAAESVYAH